MLTAEEVEAGMRAPAQAPVEPLRNSRLATAFSFFGDDEVNHQQPQPPASDLPPQPALRPATMGPVQRNPFKRLPTADEAVTNHLNALRDRDLSRSAFSSSPTDEPQSCNSRLVHAIFLLSLGCFVYCTNRIVRS